MLKPLPQVDPTDTQALARWGSQAREIQAAFHALAVDAAAKERTYARKELRKRISRLNRRLVALFDALTPTRTTPPVASAAPRPNDATEATEATEIMD